MDVTYLGPGPSLENVRPVESREKRGTIPAGFLLKATCTSGNKKTVRSITTVVGALAALGSEGDAEDTEIGSKEVERTGHLATTKVVSGGGGKGTCAVNILEEPLEVHVIVRKELETVPGDGITHTEYPAANLRYTEP